MIFDGTSPEISGLFRFAEILAGPQLPPGILNYPEFIQHRRHRGTDIA